MCSSNHELNFFENIVDSTHVADKRSLHENRFTHVTIIYGTCFSKRTTMTIFPTLFLYFFELYFKNISSFSRYFLSEPNLIHVVEFEIKQYCFHKSSMENIDGK